MDDQIITLSELRTILRSHNEFIGGIDYGFELSRVFLMDFNIEWSPQGKLDIPDNIRLGEYGINLFGRAYKDIQSALLELKRPV